ncbi:DUF763 domain-containing protein [Candidatus Microgenomates bacterium]|nr:DUF763 domain-containing protein [Candidatus Microgenomates bacterium]
MQRGVATFTLDHGQCPPWLFERMVRLGREMTQVLVDEYGPDEFIKRIADPVWFQSLGTVLAFDWNGSGLTTILTAALKEAIRGQERDLGIFICGGKGKTSRKTPEQIESWGQTLNLPQNTTKSLVRNSKMSAKVDSSLVQDGYQLYHHTFFFSTNGAWTVVQQGMNTTNKTARRYHWFDVLNPQSHHDFVNEPHAGIASQKRGGAVLNLVAKDSDKTREVSQELVKAGYKQIFDDLQLLQKHSNFASKMLSFKFKDEKYTFLKLSHQDFNHHPVEFEDFASSKYLDKILRKITEQKPGSYEAMVEMQGVGPKTVRSLALVAEVIYDAVPSYEDPARYSFAHGGKDAVPYPIDRETYDTTINILRQAVHKTKIPPLEKDKILKRL